MAVSTVVVNCHPSAMLRFGIVRCETGLASPRIVGKSSDTVGPTPWVIVLAGAPAYIG